MILLEKDPTLETLFLQEGLKARGFYAGELDNWRGPKTDAALVAAAEAVRATLPKVVKADAPTAADNLHRDISARGMDLIRHFEGLYLEAYQDSVGVWTIGWGHTGLKHNDGTVRRGRKISLAEAERLLRYDMDVFEGRVMKLAKVPLNDDQFAALVSFDFNTGGLEDSTLLRKLNAGDYAGAADELLRWDKAGGKKLAGLTRRRKSERLLFLGELNYIVRG